MALTPGTRLGVYEVAAKIAEGGGRGLAITVDVTDDDVVAAAFAETRGTLGVPRTRAGDRADLSRDLRGGRPRGRRATEWPALAPRQRSEFRRRSDTCTSTRATASRYRSASARSSIHRSGP